MLPHTAAEAGCIMQAKYLYRAGSKSDSEMSIEQKAIQDLKKFDFYLKYYQKSAKAKSAKELSKDFRCNCRKSKKLLDYISNEFIYDKPEIIRELLKELV